MATEVSAQTNKPLATVTDVPVPVVKNNEADQADDGEDDEDEVLETKGRWQKIAEQVSQRDVPGIDAAYLAVDIEEGTEVVWNEVSFSKSKAKRDKDKVITTLEQLTRLKHPNIVKFYEFWCDSESATSTTHDRLVFITEYMTSGTLLQFLKKSKKNFKPVSEKTWKRWCQQILSALCYLHKLGIIHGNLTLDTIFIQHNGLVKIGSISPQDINKHVKTSVNNISGAVHYMAPESGEKLSQATDVYAFGVCALEMLALDLLGNGETRPKVHADEIKKAIDTLTNKSIKTFISRSLSPEPSSRPTSEQLLLSPILQEVYTLMLYAAEVWNHTNETLESLPGSSDDAVSHRGYPTFNESNPDRIVAKVFSGKNLIKNFHASESRQLDLEKYIEEHLVDILYLKSLKQLQDGSYSDHQPVQQSDDTQQPKYDPEARRVIGGSCEIKIESNKKQITIKLQFDDKLQRNVSSDFLPEDTAEGVTESLINCGLINQADQHLVKGWIQEKHNLSMAANIP